MPSKIITSVQSVHIRQIRIDPKYRKTPPRPEKIASCYSFYLKHHKLDREIVIDDQYVLRDGYVGYLIAKMLGFSWLKVLQVKAIKEEIA